MPQRRRPTSPRAKMVGNAHKDPVWLWRRDELVLRFHEANGCDTSATLDSPSGE